jgi:hypothetical protein
LAHAVSRLERVMAMGGEGDQPRPKALRGYEGLLPIPKRDIGRRKVQGRRKGRAEIRRKTKKRK